jgi:ubiquinone/menaquinone biosynthesis C-methylase UbiE
VKGQHLTDGTVTPTADTIARTPYVALLALLGESNLPPGGLTAVRELAQNLHLRPGLRALHAGCNAGFLSREMARRGGCDVTGLDISADMVAAANQRAKDEGLEGQVRHLQGDVRNLTFDTGAFDVVFSGGAMAFVRGHEEAVAEMVRVTKEFGLLGDAQFYYDTEPSDALLAKVADIIEVPVPRYTRDYWVALYEMETLQPYWRQDGEAGYRSDREVDDYCDRLVRRCASSWADAAQDALRTRLGHIFHAFNENMKHMRYTAYVYRRLLPDSEPTLFT